MNWNTLLGLSVVAAFLTTIGTLLGLVLKEVVFARSFEKWKLHESLREVSRKYRDPIALSAIELANRLRRICDEYPPDYLDSELLAAPVDKPTRNTATDPHYRRYTLVSSVYRSLCILGMDRIVPTRDCILGS